MADAYTPNLSLIMPEVGASRDSWGAKWNENATTLDEFVSMAMPVGAILDYAGPIPPPGWLACDGRSISRTTYSELFQAIGSAWGAGDGTTTFNLPPASGRASVGAGSVTDANGTVRAYGFAQRVGSLSYTIAQANLPLVNFFTDAQGTHSHAGVTVGAGAHAHTTDAQGGHNHDTAGNGYGTTAGGIHAHTGWTSGDGAHAHNINLPVLGTGAASGGFAVMSNVFGTVNYGTDYQGVHTHAIQTYDSPSHSHYINWDGNHGHNISQQPDHHHGISWDGNHAHNVWSGGSGTRLEVVQPVMVVSKIIYAGSQAAVTATTAAVPLVRRLMSAPLRGSH
jgi:microcystin-dependent protein